MMACKSDESTELVRLEATWPGAKGHLDKALGPEDTASVTPLDCTMMGSTAADGVVSEEGYGPLSFLSVVFNVFWSARALCWKERGRMDMGTRGDRV